MDFFIKHKFYKKIEINYTYLLILLRFNDNYEYEWK